MVLSALYKYGFLLGSSHHRSGGIRKPAAQSKPSTVAPGTSVQGHVSQGKATDGPGSGLGLGLFKALHAHGAHGSRPDLSLRRGEPWWWALHRPPLCSARSQR